MFGGRWRKITSVTFVTHEQNALSLCPAEAPGNLVAVGIPCLSVRRRQTESCLF
jgi:hypothetical protein